MTDPPVFLEVGQVLEIHARMVRDFGGNPAVRDRGLLESAVRIPQATFDGRLLHEDLPTMQSPGHAGRNLQDSGTGMPAFVTGQSLDRSEPRRASGILRCENDHAPLAQKGPSCSRAVAHVRGSAMAAAYLFHLCMNHPFVDGNKRTALATAEVFLLLNGSVLQADDAAVEELTMALAASRTSKEQVTTFFRENTVPVQGE